MNIKAKGSVNIPKMPRNLGALMQWSKSVNAALQQLRDRTWTAPSVSTRPGVKKPVAFEVKLKKDGDANLATITPGYVRFVNPKATADSVIKDWLPEDMDLDPPTEHSVSAGQALFVKVVTDKRGEPTAVTIAVDSVGVTSIHYVPLPDDPNDVSLNGEYYYKIAEFYVEGEILKVKQFQSGGPIVHLADLWEGKNVGDGEYKVYKQIDPSEATFDFRTIKQEGLSITGAIGVLKAAEDPPGDIIPFRAIAARPSQMQINVELSGTDAIIIKGNDYDQTITLPGGGSIKTTDGLVEDMITPAIGASFTVRIWSGVLLFAASSSGDISWEKGTAPIHTIYFYEGMAFTTLPAGVSPPETIIDVAWILNEPSP